MTSQVACAMSTSTCQLASWPHRTCAQPVSCALPITAGLRQRSAVLRCFNVSLCGRRRGLGASSSLVVNASHNQQPEQPCGQPHNQHQHPHSQQRFQSANRTVKIARPRRAVPQPPPPPRQPHHSGGGSAGAVAVRADPRQPAHETSATSSSSSSNINSPSAPDANTAAAPAWGWGWWDSLPARYRIILGTSVSFIICNLDKVNLSVCIIPMAHDYGWSPTTVGLVQSAFFWGYMLCQLPGGYFNSTLGGRRILPAGVLLYSAATGVVPAVAATVPGLCLSRAFVGFGQATAPSAATDIVARAVPPSERARAVTFIFSGFHVGSILGLLAAPWLIAHSGWRSVFITFGALGLVWWLWFEQGIMARIAATEPDFAARLVTDSRTLSPPGVPSGAASGAAAVAVPKPPPLPWRAFLRSSPVRALAYTHFANNWFHYTMLAWLPTYFVDTLSVDLLHASQTALLPPLAGIAAGAAAGAAADTLIGGGKPVPWVRKLIQNVAFIFPTVLLLAACTPEVADNSGATVAAITLALGISNCSLAGLFCTHQDMSPKYAPILLGLTNTTAAIPGVLGVASVGYLFEHTESWEIALFLPSAFFMVTAAATYSLWGRNDPIDFDAADNSPFPWEAKLQSIRHRVSEALDLGVGLDSGAVDWELDTDLRPRQDLHRSAGRNATEDDEDAGDSGLVGGVRAAGAAAMRRLGGLLSSIRGGSDTRDHKD